MIFPEGLQSEAFSGFSGASACCALWFQSWPTLPPSGLPRLQEDFRSFAAAMKSLFGPKHSDLCKAKHRHEYTRIENRGRGHPK